MLDTRTEPRRQGFPEPPPKGPARAAGGLLGVVAGATFVTAEAPAGFRASDRTSTALVELGRSYAQHPSSDTPAAVAIRHAAEPAPAWMLPVAITHTRTASLVGDTLKLAAKANVSGVGLSACVSYIKVATYLLAAYPADEAIELGTGAPAPDHGPLPTITGHDEPDALHVALWALTRPGGMAEVIPAVVAAGPQYAPAAAAAAGLIGLRDGLDGIPPDWHHQMATTERCLSLAYGLLRARAFSTPLDSD
jgi:hypothetical protein